MKRRFLIVGATGNVGKHLLAALSTHADIVRVMLRNPSVSQNIPAKIEQVKGDLLQPDTLQLALEGIDSAFFITPHHEQEEKMGTNFVEACEAAAVQRLVFSSAYRPTSKRAFVRKLYRGLAWLLTPHYLPKFYVEERVLQSKCNPVVLMPSNFYDNDLPFLEQIQQGVYPQPLGSKGVNRVACVDIGDAAARAMLFPDQVPSGAYPLIGPKSLNGAQSAEVWAKALGIKVTYAGDDLDAWAALSAPFMTNKQLNDFRKTYALIQKYGGGTPSRHLEACTSLLGCPPTTYEAYVESLHLSSGARPKIKSDD